MGRLLFVVRGSGMGHATRDILIAQALRRQCPHLQIEFASYADGARALKIYGQNVVDLGLAPMGNIHQRIPRVGKLIKQQMPDIVVADEEIFAVPLSQMLDIPVVFVTNWVVSEETASYISLLLGAEKVIVVDQEDAFIPPVWLEDRLTFVGPVCPLEAVPADKASWRERLGLPNNRKIVLISAGGSDVSDVVYFGLCVYALSRLKTPLYIMAVAGPWYPILEPMKYAWATSVRFTDYLPDFLKYVIASDLVITRGGHSTLWEAALHGIPSITVPHPAHVDPLNEHYAFTMQRRGTTIVIRERELNPEFLTTTCERLLSDEQLYSKMSQAGLSYRPRVGTQAVAELIASYLKGKRSETEATLNA